MPFVPRTCLTVTCDRCGDGWTDLDCEPHFATSADAAAYATDHGWSVSGHDALCPTCLDVAGCARTGHRWGRWTPAGPFPSRDGGVWTGRVRYCGECTFAEWDPPARRREVDCEAG